MRLLLATAAVAAAVLASSGGAAITPTTSAADLAAAITSNPAFVTGASFVTAPGGNPNAVSTTPLAGFPTDGSSYAILTTGDATAAANPNTNNPDQPSPDDDQSADDGGPSIRGDSDFDVTILKVDLNVPAGANCLSVDFRFLTEEFQEFVGQPFNDAFIAELDKSTWTTSGSNITAPDNFAFDPKHNVISVNAAGKTTVTAAEAAGTTYDGATPLLAASTPITPGSHSLYLSIFDQADHILDSAVFLDNLVLGQSAGGSCKKGAQSAGGGQPSGTASGTVTLDGQPFTGGPIPYGKKVDVSNGNLTIKTRAGTLSISGRGAFGEFVLLRSSVGGKPLDILKLAGGDFGGCKNGYRTTSAVGAKKPPPKTVRRLFTKGKGSFQTRGQYSSATVRGTSWLTADRCDGTLTQVFQGTVTVRDLKKRKTILVTAGHNYLAPK